MSRIAELIAEMCPGGVEFKALGDVGQLIRGRRFTKDDMVPDGLGSIHYGEIYTRYGTSARTTFSRVRADLAPQLRFARPGDVVIAAVGETVEDVGKAVAWLGDEEVAVHDDCFIFRGSLDPKFVSYCFQASMLNTQKVRFVARAKVKRLSGENLSRLVIPVPPMAIQAEVVRILDGFAELEAALKAELNAELAARRQQFDYYRDELLSFSRERERVRWMTLGEVGEFIRGRRFTKADYVDDGIACIHYGEIYTRYGPWTRSVMSHVRPDMAPILRYARPGDVVLTDVGETVEDVGKAVAWLGDEDVAIHDHCYAFRHSMAPKFVSYYMQTALFQAQKNKHVARTKVKTLLMAGLARVTIPVPPLAEQERIVGILDMFDALVNDLSIDLGAELDGRWRQFEHYRDRLLTFEEASA